MTSDSPLRQMFPRDTFCSGFLWAESTGLVGHRCTQQQLPGNFFQLHGTKIVFRIALKMLHANKQEGGKHFQQPDGISYQRRLGQGQGRRPIYDLLLSSSSSPPLPHPPHSFPCHHKVIHLAIEYQKENRWRGHVLL